jgi:hypothetical protein
MNVSVKFGDASATEQDPVPYNPAPSSTAIRSGESGAAILTTADYDRARDSAQELSPESSKSEPRVLQTRGELYRRGLNPLVGSVTGHGLPDVRLETCVVGLACIAERGEATSQLRMLRALTLTTVADDARFKMTHIASVRVGRVHPHHRLAGRRHAAPGMASRNHVSSVEEIVALLA